MNQLNRNPNNDNVTPGLMDFSDGNVNTLTYVPELFQLWQYGVFFFSAYSTAP